MASDLQHLIEKMKSAQQAARLLEREFLLLCKWEEQGTYHEVTWWYKEGAGGSEPQRTAVVYALQDLKRGKK
jgi:hypothetical protein